MDSINRNKKGNFKRSIGINTARADMLQKPIYDGFMQNAVDMIKTLPEKDVDDFLINSSTDKNGFKMINGVLFKHDDFTVQVFLQKYGEAYSANLERLKKLNLSIVPQHIETITRGNEMFIVSKVPDTKSGELIPLVNGGYEKVSKESLLVAYRDLQKLTKAGYVDDRILRSKELWFYTPDKNSIMLPSWEFLRQIKPDEANQIMERYYQILFRKL